MAKKMDGNGSTTQGGHNITAMKSDIHDRVQKIVRLEEERSEINAAIREQRDAIIQHGINRHALKTAIAYYKMEPDQREGYDMSHSIVREAVGLGIQENLPFEPPAQGGEELPTTAEATA